MANILTGDKRNLGGFTVSRLLPHRDKKMVGPFIFFDQMGPADFPAGEGINVRPHPHVGLATVSYLFSGSMLHRDSLGSVQEIFAGDVNWMIAGHGIVHSERETLEVRTQPHHLHGLQMWVALPPEHEKTDPDFTHVAKNALPCIYRPGVMMRVLVGTAFGRQSPVRTFSPMFYVDVVADKNAVLEHPDRSMEAAVFIVSGTLEIGGRHYHAGEFVLLEAQDSELIAQEISRFVLLGGKKFERIPYINWNFVAYDRATLDAARERWRSGGFPPIPGDDLEHIPLPE